VTDIPESASSTARPITGEHIEHEEQTRSRSASAGVLVPVGVVLMIGVIFVSVYVAAFHAPKPHGLPVVAVGTPPSVRHFARGLNDELPGGFSVDRASNPGVARVAIEHRRAYGAVVRSRGVVRLLYAGANGPAVTSLLTGVVGGTARREGSTFQARDVLPGAAGDTRGLSIFYAAFGLVLAGFLFGSVTYQIAPRLALRQRLLSLAAFGVTGGVLITLIVKAFGAVPGPFVGLASVTGLMAMAAAAASMTLVRLLGAAGVGLASVVLLVLGNSTSGGSLPRAFLPSWLHPFSEVLPVGVGVRALNGLAYFHHDGLLTGIAILGGWIAACAAALFARDAHDRRRRAVKHDPVAPNGGALAARRAPVGAFLRPSSWRALAARAHRSSA